MPPKQNGSRSVIHSPKKNFKIQTTPQKQTQPTLFNLTPTPNKGSRFQLTPKKHIQTTLFTKKSTKRRNSTNDKEKIRKSRILEFHKNEQAHHSKLLKFGSVNKLLHHIQLGIFSNEEFLDYPELEITNLMFNLLLLSPYNSPDMDSILNDNGEYSAVSLNSRAFTYLNDLFDKSVKKSDNQNLDNQEVIALQEMFRNIFKFISMKNNGNTINRLIMKRQPTKNSLDIPPNKKQRFDKTIEAENIFKRKSKLESTDLNDTYDTDIDITALNKTSSKLLFNENDFFGNKPLLNANIGPWNIFKWYFKCLHFRDQDLYRLNVGTYSKLIHLIIRFYDWEFTNIEQQVSSDGKLSLEIIQELLKSTVFYNNYKGLFKFSTSKALEYFLDIVLGPIETFDNTLPNFENDNKIVKGSILLNTVIDDVGNDQTTLCLPSIPVRKALLFLYNRYLSMGDDQAGIQRLVVSIAKRMQRLNYYDIIELLHCSVDDTVFMTQIDLLLPVSSQLMANITGDQKFVSDSWTIQDSETIPEIYLDLIISSHVDDLQLKKYKLLINFQVSVWMDYNWDTLTPENRKANKLAILKAFKQLDDKFQCDLNITPLFTLKMFTS